MILKFLLLLSGIMCRSESRTLPCFIWSGYKAWGLDKAGSEAVGAVVVARYGSNPMEVINNVKEKIREIESGLPQKILPDGTVSRVTVVPFYDRTSLIKETIGTLQLPLT